MVRFSEVSPQIKMLLYVPKVSAPEYSISPLRS